MNVLRARYFDGKSSLAHDVTVMLVRGRLKIVGRDVNQEIDARALRRSSRVGATPRWLYLPGGAACVTEAHDALDRMLRESPYERTLHRWESRPAFAAAAVALVVAALWLLIDRGVPAAAEAIAERIPVEAEATLGREALAGMDRYFMEPSKLPAARQEALRAKLARISGLAGVTIPYRLEFRASPVIGANAFALPSNIIVMTDELVKLSRHDEEVLAVLAHEIGHLHHRHVMRGLLESSATALVIAGVTGDVASITSLAAAAPTLLLHAKYSREHEREADRYAIETMRKAGLEPRYFGTILARMEGKRERRRGGIPDFLSSHPPTEEREALAGAGLPALAGGEQPVADGGDPFKPVPEKPKLVALDPVQREVLALLERRDMAAVERMLAEHQLAFERDPAASAKLENAFRAFGKLRRSAEPTLDEWVQASPSSYVARIARASYYLGQGIEARGTDYISETPEENLETMRFYLEKAHADLERSLELSAKPYLAHVYLMSAARYGAGRGSEEAHYEAALKLAPQSVELRLRRMTDLEPRWGGSLAEMQALAARSREELSDVAAANRVAARIPAYRAFEQRKANDMAGALKYLDEAIALDVDATALCERSYVLVELKREAEALADVKRALSRARENRYCMRRAVYHAGRLADAEEAIAMLDLVLEVDPHATHALNQRGWRHQGLKRFDAAFRDYRASAEQGDAWAQMMTGKFLWQGQGIAEDREQAVAWLRKAADQGNRDAKVSLEQALAAMAK
jgi:Zn-dependent protease with chaperone function/TPR repeat protein